MRTAPFFSFARERELGEMGTRRHVARMERSEIRGSSRDCCSRMKSVVPSTARHHASARTSVSARLHAASLLAAVGACRALLGTTGSRRFDRVARSPGLRCAASGLRHTTDSTTRLPHRNTRREAPHPGAAVLATGVTTERRRKSACCLRQPCMSRMRRFAPCVIMQRDAQALRHSARGTGSATPAPWTRVPWPRTTGQC